MPQDNTGIIRALYRAFASGDIPSALAILDPGIEWREAENFIYADRNPYIGPQAVFEGVFARLGAEWDNFAAVSEEILGSGDTVVSLGRYRAVCKATAKPVDAQFVHVFRLRDGKVVRFQQYTDTAQFRDAMSAGRVTSA